MELVGLNAEHATVMPMSSRADSCQRIGIARALATDPKFIVCDEAVSALDVSIQAQVINMFEELQEKLGVAYLFIAHDLLVVHHISDRIAVMYLGRIVEIADSNELNENPIHPYTQSLLSAVPYPDPKMARESIVSCWREMCQARCICPADAHSALAVSTQQSSVQRNVLP